MDTKKIAQRFIYSACDKQECEELNIKFVGDSYRGILDNAIRIMDFYEPDMKSEAPMTRSTIIGEMQEILKEHESKP
jgi:hypothetical protein